MCLAVVSLVLGLAAGAARAAPSVERITLDDVHPGPEDSREVDVYFRALGRFGAAARKLDPADVSVWLDTEQIPADSFSLEPLKKTGRGVTAVLAIDASGTMRGDPFEKARESALVFLDRLDPEDRVAVVSFAEDVNVVAAFDDAREEAREAVRRLEIDPERSQHTLLWDGAHKAVELIRTGRDLPRRAFVILLSDGKDGGSDKTRDSVVQLATGRDEESHVLVFSIGYDRFGSDGLDEMQKIADATGGLFLEARSIVNLKHFFDTIATQILNSYVARFTAPMDGESHEIRITIGKASGSRTVRFPDRFQFPWIYLIGAAALLVVGLVVWLVLRSVSPGRLAIQSGPDAGKVYALKAGKTRLGGLDDNEIVLNSDSVSRYHAEIVVSGRKIEIHDLGSLNGTHVNGSPVKSSPISKGDEIRCGDVELRYDR